MFYKIKFLQIRKTSFFKYAKQVIITLINLALVTTLKINRIKKLKR